MKTLTIVTITSATAAIIQALNCNAPYNAVPKWWYNSWNDGPRDIYWNGMASYAMLNAYRAGGMEGVHWKYTDDVNDGACLVKWDYYAEDGRTWLAKINGRTTTMGDSRRWCALPVYRSGGVEGKQWATCSCWDDYPSR